MLVKAWGIFCMVMFFYELRMWELDIPPTPDIRLILSILFLLWSYQAWRHAS